MKHKCVACGTQIPRPGACAPCVRKTVNPGEVILVAGAPASGKTTHVYENAQPGDVVVDLDLLAQALGSPTSHDHDDHTMTLAAAAFDGVVERLASGRHKAPRVWVVRCCPTPKERATLASRIGADRTVVLDTPADEAKRRAEAAGRPARYPGLIDDWWDQNPTT